MRPPSSRTVLDFDRNLCGFATSAFTALNSANVRFVVLRNYERLPQHVDNDIDILVSPHQCLTAERTLAAAAIQAGYVMHHRAAFTPVSLFFYHRETLEQVQVDLFTSLGFRIFNVVPVQEAIDRSVVQNLFSRPHPVDESIVNLVTRLLYQGYVRDKYRPAILKAFSESPEVASDRMADAFGRRHAAFLLDAVTAERWSAIEHHAARLRRALIARRSLRHPVYVLRAAVKDATRLLGRWLRPPGLSVVLLGPDGCGKSTAGQLVIERLRYTFSPDKGLEIHWKPIVFFRKRRANRAPTTNPHGRPPRGRLLSFLFLCYHWLEYFLGAALQIQRVKFRNGLVMIDRHYYDFLVDPQRYRLNAPSLTVKLGAAFLPKSDLVFLLDAPAEVLQARKQEVPVTETERQRLAFLDLIEPMPNGYVVDATQAPEKVAKDIVEQVLEHLLERASKRRASMAND